MSLSWLSAVNDSIKLNYKRNVCKISFKTHQLPDDLSLYIGVGRGEMPENFFVCLNLTSKSSPALLYLRFHHQLSVFIRNVCQLRRIYQQQIISFNIILFDKFHTRVMVFGVRREIEGGMIGCHFF